MDLGLFLSHEQLLGFSDSLTQLESNLESKIDVTFTEVLKPFIVTLDMTVFSSFATCVHKPFYAPHNKHSCLKLCPL